MGAGKVADGRSRWTRLLLAILGTGLTLMVIVGLATASGSHESAAGAAARKKPPMYTYVNSVFLANHEEGHVPAALPPGDGHDGGGCSDEEGEPISLRCSSDLDTALFVGFDKLHAVHNPLQFAVPVIWNGNVWGYDVSVRPGHKAGRVYLVCAERKDS